MLLFNYIDNITVKIIISSHYAASSDFNGTKYPFTISPSEEQAFIIIPITDDNTVEKLLEQFPVSLSIQPQPGLLLGDSQASVTIVDDDGQHFQ